MAEDFRFAVVFIGQPFDQAAVVHVVRHLAMRTGWRLCANANHRLIYATCNNPQKEIVATRHDVVVISSPDVNNHLRNSHNPIPLGRDIRGKLLPFIHPNINEISNPGWIGADVIAGALAIVNLWYEGRQGITEHDGWIRFAQDWWHKSGFSDPIPLVDEWFGRVIDAAKQAGWPCIGSEFIPSLPVIVLTHDVDYLPQNFNHGFPRLIRAIARQAIIRHKPVDALRIIPRFTKKLFHSMPYLELLTITEKEEEYKARSSFQLIVAHNHQCDPRYNVFSRSINLVLRQMQKQGWEMCLHGSFLSSRITGKLAYERKRLEKALGSEILGHRQHYLNFYPVQLFDEIEKAELRYDMSVGYNDRSGPRAGTLFPYRPYNIENGRPHAFWEIPFILMDSTLASNYRFSAEMAWDHCMNVLKDFKGCASIIWHQEQMGGLLDDGYDLLYSRLLQWASEQKITFATGFSLLSSLDDAWHKTVDKS